MDNKFKVVTIVILTILALTLTLIFNLIGTTSILLSLFFFVPIILSAYWFNYHGVSTSLVLVAVLIGTDVYTGQESLLIDDLLHAVTFVGVAVIIAILSTRIRRSVDALTEVKRIMRGSESSYRSVVDHISEGLFIYDFSGKLLDCNERACLMVGYNRSELLSMNLGAINGQDDKQLMEERISLLMELDNIEFDGELISKKGEHHSVSFVASLVSTEGAGKVQSIVRDISWRKEAEEEIRSSRDQLAEAQRIAHLGSWDWNLEDNKLVWSEEAYRIFKKDSNEFIPTYERYKALLDPSDKAFVESEVQAALDYKRPVDMIYHIILDDGTRKTVQQMGKVTFDDKGNPIRMDGIVQDITDRKRIEDALRQANMKLNLMSNITRHDMRNVIMTIDGYLELASMPKNEQKRNELISKAQASLEHLDRLVQFSKDYQDIGVQSPLWNDISSILRKYEHLVKGAGRELEIDTDGLEIFADQMLEKVILNLIDNSLRYADGASRIHFFAKSTEAELVLICEDDGPGVVEAEKEQIFEKGFGKNTGLGLFMVREILGITEIAIKENGRPGMGARFEMHIPPHGYRYAVDFTQRQTTMEGVEE
ncbi:MAG: PAS domain S-box protein [Methanomassiliicoccus sp.]|nr:PAS domain S-box protein [Methanomassiliicoccus sp.]